jgi:hypothetical protein
MGVALMLPAQAGSPAWFAGAMLAMGGSSGAADVWMNARLATIEAARRMKLMNLNHAVYSFAYAGGGGDRAGARGGNRALDDPDRGRGSGRGAGLGRGRARRKDRRRGRGRAPATAPSWARCRYWPGFWR